MTAYILRRLLATIPVMVVVALFVFLLLHLTPGDPVAVDLAGGSTLTYLVESVARLPKTDLPVGEVFARDGAPRLTLVTCGGPFDYDAHGYRDNVVVFARQDVP